MKNWAIFGFAAGIGNFTKCVIVLFGLVLAYIVQTMFHVKTKFGSFIVGSNL